MDLARAIISLKPGRVWVLTGNEYSGLEWKGDPADKPTEEELIAEGDRLLAADQAVAYQKLRVAEYPSITDYLDGVVKDDKDQIKKYIDDCKAVKAKYPKPVK